MPAHARHADDPAPKHARRASSSTPGHARHASSAASASAKHGRHARHAAPAKAAAVADPATTAADETAKRASTSNSQPHIKGKPALLIGCGVLVLALAGGSVFALNSPEKAQQSVAPSTTLKASDKAKDAKKVSSLVDDLRKKTFYLTQSMHGRCTITSCAMLLRRKSYLDGNKNWGNIVEDSLYDDAWVWGTGIKHNFTSQGYSVRSFTWKANPDPQDRTRRLARLLEKHPEGIVIYDEYVPHAIVLTRYDEKTSTFYCADPAGSSFSGREIKIAKSWNGTVRGSQNGVICSLNRSWYVAGKEKPAAKEQS